VPDHVLGDCCLRHLNTEFQEFPMNARSAPARVGQTHVPDEIPNFRRYRRATFATPTLPSPIEAKSLAMPGDNRLRFDKEQRRSPIVPQPREPNPQDSISPTETELMTAVRCPRNAQAPHGDPGAAEPADLPSRERPAFESGQSRSPRHQSRNLALRGLQKAGR